MPKLSYREYQRHRREFWHHKQAEERRRVEKYGLQESDAGEVSS